MIFLHPYWLWIAAALLPAGVGLYLASRRVRRRRLAMFTTFEEAAAMLRSRQEARRALRHGVATAGLMAVAFALARPLTGPLQGHARGEGIDVLLALDVSKSMLAEDMPPTRLDAARKAIHAWLGTLSNDRVGLILFAGESFLQIPMTNDFVVLEKLLDAATVNSVGAGGSNLENPIQTAVDVYARETGKNKVVILFSDGESTTGDAERRAGEAFGKNGVRVYTIGLGTAEGAQVPQTVRGGVKAGVARNSYGAAVKSRLDANKLRAIAAAAGGTYFSLVDNPNALEDLQRENFSQLARESRELHAEDYNEWFQLPLLIALLALAGERFADRLVPAARPVAVAARSPVGRIARVGLLILLTARVGAAAPFQEMDLKTAQQMVRDGKAAKVVESLRAQSERNPQDLRTLYNLGVAAYAAGDHATAAGAFERVLSESADEYQAKALFQLGNSRVRLAEGLAANNDPGAAALELERALQIYDQAAPRDQAARQNREVAQEMYLRNLDLVAQRSLDGADHSKDLQDQRRNLQKALGALDKMRERKPAEAALKQRQDEVKNRLAANFLQGAADKRKEANDLFAMNKVQDASAKMEAALDEASSALNTGAMTPQANQAMAEIRQRFSEMMRARAQQDLDKAAAEKHPTKRLNELQNASDTAQKALDLNENNMAAKDVLAQARKELEKAAVAEADRAAEAAANAKDATALASNLNRAVTKYHQALDLNPDNQRAKEQTAALEPKLAEAAAEMGRQELAQAKEAAAKKDRADLQATMDHLNKAEQGLSQAADHGMDAEKLKGANREVAALAAETQSKLQAAMGADEKEKDGHPNDRAENPADQPPGDVRPDAKDTSREPKKTKTFADIRKVSSGPANKRPAEDW